MLKFTTLALGLALKIQNEYSLVEESELNQEGLAKTFDDAESITPKLPDATNILALFGEKGVSWSTKKITIDGWKIDARLFPWNGNNRFLKLFAEKPLSDTSGYHRLAFKMDYKNGPKGRVLGPGKDDLSITDSDGGNKVAEWECEKIHGKCQTLGIDLAKINSLTAVPTIDPKYSHKIWKQYGWKFNFSFQEESMVLKATKDENAKDIDVYVTL